MASWRRRQWRSRRTDPGAAGLRFFLGAAAAGLLAGLSVWCLIADEIPIGTRGGVLWIGDRRKTGFGVLFLGAAAALHFGAIRPLLRIWKPIWIPGRVLGLMAAATGFVLTI